MTVAMEWERATGAEACIDGERLAYEVEQRLRRTVFAAGDSELVLQGRIAPRDGQPGFEATMRIVRATGELLGQRDLSSSETNCAELTDSLSLIAALMVDLPQRGLRLTVPQPEPEVPTSAPGAGGSPRPAESSFDMGAGATLAAGLHPDAALGVRAFVRWTPPAFIPLELDLAYSLKGEATISNGGGEFQSGHVGLAACPLSVNAGVLGTSACLGVQGGLVHGRGFGFDRTLEKLTWMINATLSVPLRLAALPWLGIELRPAVAVPFVRDAFIMRESDGQERDVHRVAPVVVAGQLSLVVTL